MLSTEAVKKMKKDHNQVALVIIDMQNDFITGGSLGCHNSLEIIPKINELISGWEWSRVVLTRDWHPQDHISFASNYKDGTTPPFTLVHLEENNTDQVLWPDHCVQGGHGAEFHKDLNTKGGVIISKGTNRMVESYSCFTTKLEDPRWFEDTNMEDMIE